MLSIFVNVICSRQERRSLFVVSMHRFNDCRNIETDDELYGTLSRLLRSVHSVGVVVIVDGFSTQGCYLAETES